MKNILTGMFLLVATLSFLSAEIDDEEIKSQTVSCKQGYALACFFLEEVYLSMDDKVQALSFREDGIEIEKKSCNRGTPQSCFSLAEKAEKGSNEAKELYKKAKSLFTRSCAMKNRDSCFSLAELDFGDAMDSDVQGMAEDKAIYLRAQACNYGDALACTKCGDAYRERVGENKDMNKANEFYSKALRLYDASCRNSNSEGCISAGLMYSSGLVEGGAGKAMEYYNKAISSYENLCRKKMPNACYSLGVMYYEGKTVEADLEKAQDILNKGCAVGSSDSCNLLEKISPVK